MDLAQLTWRVGRRLSRRSVEVAARTLAPLVSLRPPAAVHAWAETVGRATGRAPTGRQRRLLLENWLRNALWSFSVAGWRPGEILAAVRISDADTQKLRDSLDGPGLVVALPHMGSWDCAGAWAAELGLPVVSVAERLPDGLYERFRDARAAMGIVVYPVDQHDVLDRLAEDVAARRIVCLVSDRALSSHGMSVPWPGAGDIRLPTGPATLALRTGAHLRVATTRFSGSRLHIQVSDPVAGETPADLLRGVAAHFAEAVRESPENWLMLRRVFR